MILTWKNCETEITENLDKIIQNSEKYKKEHLNFISSSNKFVDNNEGVFNEQMCDEHINLINFDKYLFNFFSKQGKVELCDIYDLNTNSFIHVKMPGGDKSKSIGHLSNQAYVSSYLLTDSNVKGNKNKNFFNFFKRSLIFKINLKIIKILLKNGYIKNKNYKDFLIFLVNQTTNEKYILKYLKNSILKNDLKITINNKDIIDAINSWIDSSILKNNNFKNFNDSDIKDINYLIAKKEEAIKLNSFNEFNVIFLIIIEKNKESSGTLPFLAKLELYNSYKTIKAMSDNINSYIYITNKNT